MMGIRDNGGYVRGSTRHGAAARPGFSLIEVLIAIFVLALGLLGVAAVFPAVVRQQRAATDTVQGISIQRSVEQLLLGHQRLNKQNNVDVTGAITDRRGWGSLAADPQFSANGAWTTANPVAGAAPAAAGVGLNMANGTMFVGRPDGGPDASELSFIEIPVAERLIPQPYSAAGVEPRYVWDFVARRVPSGGASNLRLQYLQEIGLDDDTIQLAVFVRRIDAGIRIPAGYSYADVLTGRNGAVNENRRLPLTVDAQGKPRNDGRIETMGGYSPIVRRQYNLINTADGDVDPSLILDPAAANDELSQYFRQINQQFVDDLGVVHRVTEIVRDPASAVVALRIDPPLSADLTRNDWTGDRYMLYTPQVPAAVSIVNIKR